MDEQTINQMFEIIYGNMTGIIPSSTTKEQDYVIWRKSFDKGLGSGVRYILDVRDGLLCGYLCYGDGPHGIHLSELQVRRECQGDGKTLRRLLSRFTAEIEASQAEAVYTYANRLNRASNSLIVKVGFRLIEETERGFRYQIGRKELLQRLARLRRSRERGFG